MISSIVLTVDRRYQPDVGFTSGYNVCESKILSQSKSLLSNLSDLEIKENQLDSKSYSIHPIDLKDLDRVQEVIGRTILARNGDVGDLEICFIFECVLVYMPVVDSDRLLTYLAATFPHATLVSYEQVNLNDRFGQVMLENLTTRGCGLGPEL